MKSKNFFLRLMIVMLCIFLTMQGNNSAFATDTVVNEENSENMTIDESTDEIIVEESQDEENNEDQNINPTTDDDPNDPNPGQGTETTINEVSVRWESIGSPSGGSSYKGTCYLEDLYGSQDLSIYTSGYERLYSSSVTFYPTINFSFSGSFDIKVDDIEVRIPAHILKSKDDGKYIDTLKFPADVITKAAMEKMTDDQKRAVKSPLYYYLDEETQEYVIKNYADVPGGFDAMIQFSITTSSLTEAFDNVQGTIPDDIYKTHDGVSNSMTRYRNEINFVEYAKKEEGRSHPFYANVTLRKNDTEEVTKESNKIYAQIDTWSELYDVSKTGTLYYSWQSSWGGEPENSENEDYAYVLWLVKPRVMGGTQYYDLHYEDDLTDLSVVDSTGQKKEIEMKIIGYNGTINTGGTYTDATQLPFTDSEGNALYPSLTDDQGYVDINGTRKGSAADGVGTSDKLNSANITMLIRIKKSDLATGDIIKNHVKAELVEEQDLKATSWEADGEVIYVEQVPFAPPPGYYNLEKKGGSTVYGGVDMLLKDTDVVTSFTNSATFRGYEYTLKDDGDPNKPEDYGDNFYTVQLTDDMIFLKGSNQTSVLPNEYNDFNGTTRLQADEYNITQVKAVYSLSDYVYKDSSNSWVSQQITDYDTASAHGEYLKLYVKTYEEGKSKNVDDLNWELAATIKRGTTTSSYGKYTLTSEPGFSIKMVQSGYTNLWELTFSNTNIVAIKAEVDSCHFSTTVDLNIPSSGLIVKSTERTKLFLQKEGNEENPVYDYGHVLNVNTLTVKDKDGNIVALPFTDLSNSATNCRYPYADWYAEDYVNERDQKNKLEGKACHAAVTSTLTEFSKSSGIEKILLTSRATTNREIELDYQIKMYERLNHSLSYTGSTALNYLVNNGFFEPQTTGTFYDLLPPGVEPDLDTVKVTGMNVGFESTTFDDYYYKKPADDFEITRKEAIPNWRGTGRTMLIVTTEFDSIGDVAAQSSRVNCVTSGMKLTFTGKLSYTDYILHGKTLVNYVAYETGNEKITSGYADNGYAFSGNIRAAYDDVNDDGEYANRYLYGSATSTLSHLISLDFGLTKRVQGVAGGYGKGEDNSAWTTPGGDYSYQLIMTSGDGSDTSGIIFYDSLENYVPLSDEQGYGEPSWQGTLSSVDTSWLKQQGAKPVVYYSTIEKLNLDIEDNRNLYNSTIWVKDSDYTGDLKDVKAIAVDLGDFVVKEKTAAYIIINMKAPTGNVVELIKNNVHAYNNAYATAKKSNAGTNVWGELSTVHENYTQIFIDADLMDIPVEKVWEDEDDQYGLRPNEITVTLYANGEEVAKATLSESTDWKHTFKDLLVNDLEGNPIKYTVKEDTVRFYDTQVSEGIDQYVDEDKTDIETRTFTITNTLQDMGDIIVTKKVTGTGGDTKKMFTFMMTLYKVSDDGTETLAHVNGQYGDMNFVNGIAKFTLKHGEQKQASYLPAGVKYVVTEIDNEDYEVTMTNETGVIEKDAAIEVNFTNHRDRPPVQDIPVEKIWEDGEDQYGLRPDEITVILYADGKEVDKAVLTKDNGWKHTFKDQQIQDEQGRLIKYTVEEEPVKFYNAEITAPLHRTDSESQEFTITNTLQGIGDLTVTKEVTGTAGDTEKEFHFIVELSDTTINGIYGDMNFINGVAEITLRHGEEKTALHLPAGIEYKVTEIDNEDYEVSYSGETGLIPEYDTAYVEVINHKDAPTSSKTATLIIYKIDQDEDFLEGAGFELIQVTDEGQHISLKKLEGLPKFEFTGLEEGHYIINEYRTPDGYEGIGTFEIDVIDGEIYYAGESYDSLAVMNTNDGTIPKVLGDQIEDQDYIEWYLEHYGKKVETGDHSQIYLWASASIISLAIILFLTTMKKRKE